MKQIKITRDNNDKVAFDEVSTVENENVFFTNLDSQAAHWPDLSANQLGAAPSPNSSQCIVPPPGNLTPPNNQVSYKCKIQGHDEKGIINVFAALAADTVTLADATKGNPIPNQQVVVGGKSPYAISGEQFEVIDNNNSIIDSGSGIGPNLQLNPDQTNSGGITVSGTPTLSGTYNFTFEVDDAMGGNLQQVQYSMKVS